MECNNNYRDKIIIPLLEEYDIDTNLLISCTFSAKDRDVKIVYSCICGQEVERTEARSIRKRPLCHDCMPKEKTGPSIITLRQFSNLLEEFGYKLKNPKCPEFKGAKSVVETIDPDGEIYRVSYSNFKKGSRPKKYANKKNAHTNDIVRHKVIEAGFLWIEGTIYKNRTTPFFVVCHCGSKFEVSYDHLHESRIGCPECYRYNRKYNWEYIKGIAEKYGCIIASSKDNYKGRDSVIEVFCACGNAFFKVIRYFLKSPRCPDCTIILRQNTNMKKYGHTNFLCSEKGKQYNKESREKAVKTHIKRWGFPPGCSPEIRQKMKNTNMEKYGCQYSFGSKLVQEKSRNTFMRKYGCEYPMQNPFFLEKAQKTAFSLKEYTFPSGNIVHVQGYEWMCLNLLQSNSPFCNAREEFIITGAKNVPKVEYIFEGTNRRYFMDIYVKNIKTGIEVKSVYTLKFDPEKNRAKWIAASLIEECKEFCIYVFDKKGPVFGYYLQKGELIAKSTFKIDKNGNVCSEKCFPVDDWDD